MNEIYNCRLFVLLQEFRDGALSHSDIEFAYGEFREQLVSISDSSDNYTSKFRLLTDLQIRLHLLSTSIAPDPGLKKKCFRRFLS